jgi:ABC-type lipoprotein export system ATPase subunit
MITHDARVAADADRRVAVRDGQVLAGVKAGLTAMELQRLDQACDEPDGDRREVPG